MKRHKFTSPIGTNWDLSFWTPVNFEVEYFFNKETEGGLTDAANVVDSWFFQRPAVGLAIGIDMKTEINWIPERTAWLSNGMLKAGSVVRDEGGLVKVQYDKTA